jgi:hypothetical protein
VTKLRELVVALGDRVLTETEARRNQAREITQLRAEVSQLRAKVRTLDRR